MSFYVSRVRVNVLFLGTTAKNVQMVWTCVANLRKEDNNWVKKCTEYEVEGARARGRPNRTWTEVVQKDCQARKLNREDSMHHSRGK